MNIQMVTRRRISARTKRTRLTLPALGLLAVSLAVLLPAAARAATFVVNSTADAVDAARGNGVCATDTSSPAAGACTLRAAIQEANALAGAPHTIVLPAGTYILTIPGAEDAAASGDLDITASMTISGAGAAATIIDANDIGRVFQVMRGSVVTISGVTARRGNGYLEPGVGGGVLNDGTLTLNDSVVSRNRGGAGIVNRGTLTLNNSGVSGNTAKTAPAASTTTTAH
jgi:CSLREA domain-containing protein